MELKGVVTPAGAAVLLMAVNHTQEHRATGPAEGAGVVVLMKFTTVVAG